MTYRRQMVIQWSLAFVGICLFSTTTGRNWPRDCIDIHQSVPTCIIFISFRFIRNIFLSADLTSQTVSLTLPFNVASYTNLFAAFSFSPQRMQPRHVFVLKWEKKRSIVAQTLRTLAFYYYLVDCCFSSLYHRALSFFM